MPLYEYACRGCDREVEILVRNERETPECPDCGSTELTKLLSVPAGHSGSLPDSEGPPIGPCGSACGCFPQ